MRFTLFFGFFIAFSMAQYDDISILGEVLERSTGQPEGSGIEETASTTTEKATTTTEAATTTEEVTTVPTITEQEVSSTSTASKIISTEATTEKVETTTAEETTTTTTTTIESTTTSTTTTTTEAPVTTENVLVPETLAPEEDVDEESFLGFKKPDLATIYRRLFPFQHTPHRDYKL